jgi:hypothetical protein
VPVREVLVDQGSKESRRVFRHARTTRDGCTVLHREGTEEGHHSTTDGRLCLRSDRAAAWFADVDRIVASSPSAPCQPPPRDDGVSSGGGGGMGAGMSATPPPPVVICFITGNDAPREPTLPAAKAALAARYEADVVPLEYDFPAAGPDSAAGYRMAIFDSHPTGSQTNARLSTDGHILCTKRTMSADRGRVYTAWMPPTDAAKLVDQALVGFRTGDIDNAKPSFVQAFRVDGDRMAATAINATLFAQWRVIGARLDESCTF